jgi:hypothetical protein
VTAFQHEHHGVPGKKHFPAEGLGQVAVLDKSDAFDGKQVGFLTAPEVVGYLDEHTVKES